MRKIDLVNTNAADKRTIKEINEKLILNVIREFQPISRVRISKRTGLQRSTVSIITARLIKEGWISEGESAQAEFGRKPQNLYLNAGKFHVLGVEVSGGESTLALADANGIILRRWYQATSGNGASFFRDLGRRISNCIREAEESSGTPVDAIGVSLPGYIETKSGRIIGAENLGWRDLDAGEYLRESVELPMFFGNNAKLAAFSEVWFNSTSGRNLRHFVYIITRDGLGTGFIIDGEIYNGARDGAAEFGHFSLFPYGRRCSCGNYGCWEVYASDLAAVRIYRERSARMGISVPSDITVEAIIERAREGERVAIETLEKVGTYLGLGVANLVYGFNPQKVIVGDSLGKAWFILGKIVEKTVRQRVPDYYLEGLEIEVASRGENSCLLGAVALALAHKFSISNPLRREAG
ncbi:MAG TPA: ROK family transcriptional regulator [Acidobacteriota bacterium]|nr:ROK family transcriptional regulator [Acidobacteriota bacterium]